MTDLSNIKLYATHPHPCSYLEGEYATTVFVDPATNMNAPLYSELSDYGFRRSGEHIYRPKCETCQACIPIRVLASNFAPSRAQKRCVKRNRDLQTTTTSSIDTDEHFALYCRYIKARHNDGDMFPPCRDQYRDFLTSEWDVTQYLEYRTPSGELVAVSVSDILTNGVSAIYTFYDPNENKRSLGVYGILFQIHWATEMQLPYVYLGYWIKRCQKMKYKTEYQPFQLLINNTWINVA